MSYPVWIGHCRTSLGRVTGPSLGPLAMVTAAALIAWNPRQLVLSRALIRLPPVRVILAVAVAALGWSRSTSPATKDLTVGAVRPCRAPVCAAHSERNRKAHTMSPLGNQNQPVVVGVDGSEQSGFALRWAAEFAAQHRAPLDIVFAIDIPADYYYGPGLSGPLCDRATMHRQGKEDVADAAASEAAALTAPIADIPISASVLEGSPVAVLRGRSTSARLIVVGSRGLGALRRTLLGSVSTSLARHADCPVAVIPDAPVDAEGPVVVGVDGSACSADAIGIAFDEASRRGVPLVAVNAWSEFYRYEARSTMQTEAEALLSESIAGYAEKYPEVRVDRVVVEDRPARAVLDASEGAQLVVVGSHGRGGFAGMTLGSVAQAVLHGAESPVIIARPRSQE